MSQVIAPTDLLPTGAASVRNCPSSTSLRCCHAQEEVWPPQKRNYIQEQLLLKETHIAFPSPHLFVLCQTQLINPILLYRIQILKCYISSRISQHCQSHMKWAINLCNLQQYFKRLQFTFEEENSKPRQIECIQRCLSLS